MKKIFVNLSVTLALVALAATTALADLRIKTRTTAAGQSFEGTTLIKGSRQRTETDMGMKSVSIMQCDLKRNVQINDAARTYFVMPFGGAEDSGGGASAAPSAAAARTASGPARRGGVVTYTLHMTDTGERKQMFGLTARHVKTTMTFESSPDACTQQKMKMEYDGWYVDLPGFSCEVGASGYGGGAGGARPDCVDRVVFKTTGNGKRGYPLHETMTMYGADGRVQMTTTQEALELSQATLDAALFDVPAGYRLAASMQELYTGGATMPGADDDGGDDDRNDGDDDDTPPRTAAAEANAGGASAAALGPKRAGVVRVGLILPRAQMVEGRGSNEQAAEAVRAELMTLLRGPSLEAVALDAQTPEQALEEARLKECDYVLVTAVKQKKGGGGMFGGLGRVADAAASHIPYGNTAGEAAAREAARVAVHSTAELAVSVKAKDEVTLDYELRPASGGAAVLKSTAKAKAQSDGENVFPPLVGKAAGEVAEAASGRR